MTLGTTVGDLVQRVRRDNLLGVSGPTYSLAANYTAGGTTMTLAQPPGAISTFSTVTIDESMYLVTAVDDVGSIITVIPDYAGTVSVNHSAGDLVEVDARFPTASLLHWAQLEIMSWGSKIWRVRSQDLAVTARGVLYDFPLTDPADEVLFLLDLRKEPVGTTSVNSDREAHVPARVLRGRSPLGLQLTDRPGFDTTLRVVYATKFDLDPFTSATDLVDDVGLLAQHLDLLEWGVRWRALVSPVASRTDWRSAGVSRDGQEVTALDVIRAADHARSNRDRRLMDEANELRRDFPYRDSGS